MSKWPPNLKFFPSTEENGFTMIITAFRDATNYGCHNGFQCSKNTCIDHDLVCDNIHHCVDGADERHSEFCTCKFCFLSSDLVFT